MGKHVGGWCWGWTYVVEKVVRWLMGVLDRSVNAERRCYEVGRVEGRVPPGARRRQQGTVLVIRKWKSAILGATGPVSL